MASSINVKELVLILRTSKAFQLVIDGFSKSSLWSISFLQSPRLIASILLQVKATVSIYIKNTLSFGTMFLSGKISAALTQRINLSAFAKLTYSVSSSLLVSNVINALLKATVKASAALNTTQSLVLDMVTAVFNTLLDYDPDTLLSMDTETLGDLDYTAT